MPNKTNDALQVAQYMAELNHPMKNGIEELRKLIQSVHPDIKERIKWNAPSYHYYGVDFLTFGPLMRKKEEIILVFHHPEIVHISSTLLEGKYLDRRLINIKSESEISRHETEIVKIISNLISKIM